MTRRIALILTVIFCLLIVAGAGSAAVKDNWISVRSKNFFLIGSAGEKGMRQVAVKLEQFREGTRAGGRTAKPSRLSSCLSNFG